MREKYNLVVLLALFLASTSAVGCGAPDWVRSMNDSFKFGGSVDREVEEKHRRDYAATHSRKAMRWLLGHCVDTGMSYDQICRVMGEEGTPESHDRQLKTGGGYLIDDEMYSWKDAEGRSIVLGFREGRLVNFDRAEFR
ncbi:MAG: hypothetical protein JSS02_06680 [Planctomycetes bacterium]|nr:hypothetical protein [Planctomycetota bacterium]